MTLFRIGVVILFQILTAGGDSVARGSEAAWRRLPAAKIRSGRVDQLAFDGRVVWAKGEALVYWDGHDWQLPEGRHIQSGLYSTVFVGGGDRPLYYTLHTNEPDPLALYRLRNGMAEYVTDVDVRSRLESPQLLVTADGHVLNLGIESPASFDGRQWNQLKVDTPVLGFVEALDSLFLISATRRFTRVQNGKVISSIAVEIPRFDLRNATWVRWGTDHALSLSQYDSQLIAVDLTSGQTIDITWIRKQLGDVVIESIYGKNDGSVWLTIRDKREMSTRLVSLAPSDELVEFTEATELGLPTLSRDCRFLEAGDGSQWLSFRHAVIRIGSGNVSRFGRMTGLNLAGCQLVEDAMGNIFACNGSAYIFTSQPDLLAGLPAPTPIVESEANWTVPANSRRNFGGAWRRGDQLVVTSKSIPLRVFEIQSGKELFQLPLDVNPEVGLPHAPWIVTTDQDRLEIATSTDIYVIDQAKREVTSKFPLIHDYRIAPVRTADGYLVVPSGRGRTLKMINFDGQTSWTAELPGYVRGHLVVHDDQVIIQTRDNSYGGQCTLGVDLESGEQVWLEKVNAYGNGVVTSAGPAAIVEVDYWMNPQQTEGWLVARDKSGERLWTHRVAGEEPAMPIMGPGGRRVYGIFERGTVVCLDSATGSVIWETFLSESLSKDGVFGSYDAAFPVHQLWGDKLFIVDQNLTFHVLDADAGTVLTRIAIPSKSTMVPVSSRELIAMPCIMPSQIVFGFKDEIVAIANPIAYAQPTSPAPPIVCPPSSSVAQAGVIQWPIIPAIETVCCNPTQVPCCFVAQSCDSHQHSACLRILHRPRFRFQSCR